MAGELLVMPSRATDGNNVILAGAKWYFYNAGTLTPRNVYSDAELTTSLGSVVTADAEGLFPNIYFDARFQYRGILQSADGSIEPFDISPINSSVLSAISGPNGAASIGFIQSGPGAVAMDLEEAMRFVSVTLEQFGGGTEKTGAQNRAALVNAWASHSVVSLGRGSYPMDFTSPFLVPSGKALVGAGSEASGIVRTDTTSGTAFLLRDTAGSNVFRDFSFTGNSQASGYLDGGFVAMDITAAATGAMRNIKIERIRLAGLRGDGYIAATQTGAQFLTDIVIRDISVATDCNRRLNAGVDDVGIPNAVVWLQGHATNSGDIGRVVRVLVDGIRGDIPNVKGVAVIAAGVVDVEFRNVDIERLGTNVANDRGGYAFLLVNESGGGDLAALISSIGAPNPDNIRIIEPTIRHGKSCGLYTACWAGFNHCRVTWVQRAGSYIGGLVDTLDATLPKAAIALTDSNTTIMIDGLDARQCWKAVAIPLGAEQNISMRDIRHSSIKATAFPRPGTNIGNGSITLHPSNKLLPGYTGGVYKVEVTAGGGTPTPTFTVKRPSGSTVGTYTVGGADFATEIGFKITNGAVNFSSTDAFLINVETLQVPDGEQTIIISRHVGGPTGGGTVPVTGGFNAGPSGPITIGNVTCVLHGANSRGIVFLCEDAIATPFYYGATRFDGHLDIECQGDAVSIWSQNDADPIFPFPKGLSFVGSGVIKSQTSRGFMLRGVSSRVDFGGCYRVNRSDNASIAITGSAIDAENCQNLHVIQSGALTLSGWGVNAGDGVAWAGTGARGSIALGGISFVGTLTAYRAVGMGTAKPAWTPTPNADGPIVANLIKGAPVNFAIVDSGTDTVNVPAIVTHWEYTNFQWYVVRSIIATT